MPELIFKEINQEIEQQIIARWGNWVKEYNCLHYGDGCYSLAAMYDEKPIGFISTYPSQLPPPLQIHRDAYIDVLDVHKDFRRQGIARELLSKTEVWAKAYGYRQIRSWSSDDKSEAIPMWYALGYGVCPAIMRGVSVKKSFSGNRSTAFMFPRFYNRITIPMRGDLNASTSF